MQEDDAVWQKYSAQYDFNAVYFYVGDATNWGQAFLVTRIDDLNWAPVFADQNAIIFLKRNEKNKDLISRFEIPRDHFGITKL